MEATGAEPLGIAADALLLPVFEHLFHITTDIRLLELSNQNLPLLRTLALEAPGTYQHSLMLGHLAEAAADLLTEGAGSRTSEQLAREIETLGGRISSTANDDYAEVIGSVVAENVERMMSMLADVVIRPSFPENEVALHKRNRVQNLVVQRQDPAYLASEQFDRVVFGSHPYAIASPSPASIEALNREKIEQFYRDGYVRMAELIVEYFHAA